MSSHSKQSWKIAVISAILWNSTVTLLKFAVFFISWSSSMFSEWVHSFADTMNQILLYIWLKKSTKKADEKFSYWYWKERFFWAILSACWIFFIWAWVTIYHWIEWLIHPKVIENAFLSYIVLLISFIIEWFTLLIAIKSIYKKDLWLVDSIKKSDNASFAVILEDSVAVFWVFIAFVSIFLSKTTGIIYFDSIWSIIIWILLWFVAIILIIQNKSYLMWRTIDEDIKEDIISLIEQDPLINKVVDFKSEIIDIWSYIIKCEADFNWTSLMTEINNNGFLSEEYEYIKDDYNEFLKFCVDYTNRIPRLIWKNIDELEKTIMQNYPEVKHIDIELN